MFSIKEVSTNLNITPQAIYKQKKALQQKGYMTNKIELVDMFPFTEHVETVCLMSRKEK